MKITWVARSFLDYRVPVYIAINNLCNNQLTLIYNGDKVPERVQKKIKAALGKRAISLTNEFRLQTFGSANESMANHGFSIPYHPQLIKEIRKSQPDVIVSDGFLKWTYASLWVRAFNIKGIKHVMCYERTPHTERNAGFLRTIYRKFASIWIDAIDCNGKLTINYVTKQLGYKKILTTGHMTADTDGLIKSIKKTPQTEVDIIKKKYNLSELTFIYVGRLIKLKGIMEMLYAWNEANLPNTSLMLVGDGDQREEIERYVKEHALTSVKIVGAIDYDLIAAYYKAANCFIIPTLEDNWSLVVPEAMSCGLPILCSIYNGCWPELVRKENGWTFDPLNTPSLVKALKNSYQAKDKLAEMGQQSKKIVAHYTPQHGAQGIYDACLKVLNKQ